MATHARRRALRAVACLACVLSAEAFGCAVPPEYPRDDRHLAADSARVCFECHVIGDGPRPHPSHFEDDGSFKAKQRNCHNCHEPVPEPDRSSVGAAGDGERGE